LQLAVVYAHRLTRALEFVIFDVRRNSGDRPIGPTSPEMRNVSSKIQKLLNIKYERAQINDPLAWSLIDILEASGW